MLIDVVNRIIELGLTLAIVFVAPIMIAYSGFLYVLNVENPGNIDKAKNILKRTVIGIVIALSAWMVVDAIMAALYDSSNAGGAWWTLVSSQGADTCLPQPGALPGAGLNQAVTPAAGGGVTVVAPGGGALSYTAEAQKQTGDASGPLSSLISCLESNLSSAATVTSISDHVITDGTHTIQECAASGKSIGCSHTANSCHYGGRNCPGASYAVDISGNANDIISAAQTCGASYLNEVDHVHVSVGAQNGCGCDASLE